MNESALYEMQVKLIYQKNDIWNNELNKWLLRVVNTESLNPINEP